MKLVLCSQTYTKTLPYYTLPSTYDIHTGLPTKDKTSETTLNNQYCLLSVFMIPCHDANINLLNHINKLLNDYIQGRRLHLI